MKLFSAFTALLCLVMVSCNENNDINGNTEMTPEEKYSIEIENLISTQNGEFNSEELYSKLTSSVLLFEEGIYHHHNGEISKPMFESNDPQTKKYLFFNDNKYWACFDEIEFPGQYYSPDPCSVKNDWSYNFENNELTIVVTRIFECRTCEVKSKVVYFDGYKMITRGCFHDFDPLFKEVVNIFKFEGDREIAEETYKPDVAI